jgi:hypothetical protein
MTRAGVGIGVGVGVGVGGSVGVDEARAKTVPVGLAAGVEVWVGVAPTVADGAKLERVGTDVQPTNAEMAITHATQRSNFCSIVNHY